MANGIEESQALVVAHPPDSMLAIIERAVMSPDFDVNKLAALLALRERMEEREAKRAFVAAMNDFKKSPPVISKNKHVAFGQTAYDHATLDHVCDVVTKSLSEHGISHRWKVEQVEGQIRVTCILTHDMGHSEETTLSGGADSSGSKNSIQAIGSTVTYLQRYTLLAATGLAASNGDTDGVTNGDLAERIEFLHNAGNVEELRRLFEAYYKEFAGNAAAQRALIAAKDARKKAL